MGGMVEQVFEESDVAVVVLSKKQRQRQRQNGKNIPSASDIGKPALGREVPVRQARAGREVLARAPSAFRVAPGELCRGSCGLAWV